MTMIPVYVGTAGRSIPRELTNHFPDGESHLARYAARFPAVEINSSFYRPHRSTTYQRWATTVPPEFRFSIKIPKAITHDGRLVIETDVLQKFLDEVSGLGNRLGCLLVQLPPSLKFDPRAATRFFSILRRLTSVPAACERRHASWFDSEADTVLKDFDIAGVAADPACVPAAALPGAWNRLVYYRLHGSPRMYYSEHPVEYLSTLTQSLEAARVAGRECWCIFDNTAAGAATHNALQVHSALL